MKAELIVLAFSATSALRHKVKFTELVYVHRRKTYLSLVRKHPDTGEVHTFTYPWSTIVSLHVEGESPQLDGYPKPNSDMS